MKRVKLLTKRPIVAGKPAGDDTIRATTSPLRTLGPTVAGIIACGLLAAAPPLAATTTAQTAGLALTAHSDPENGYSNSFRYPTALDDWRAAQSQGRAHPGDLQAPRGALVFWDITQPYGHVGISRGDGTFVATDVDKRYTAIGAARLPYFSHYLGWAYPTS